jgi:chemotaxis protein CheX
MKAEHINPFLLATTEVMEKMAFTKVTARPAHLKHGNKSWGDVSGIIGLASDTWKGNMVLSFDEPSILRIVSKMLQEEFTTIDRDVIDAVGELTNMISGKAKSLLSELGLKFDMASPIMITGKDIEISQLKGGPVITIPFSTAAGNFVVEANLIKVK